MTSRIALEGHVSFRSLLAWLLDESPSPVAPRRRARPRVTEPLTRSIDSVQVAVTRKLDKRRIL